jgi:DNA-binding transcriptional LysR family regulator
MDVSLARTFLAVIDGGSFVEAAKRVHVTQSTVSMRVKALEQLLGKALFVRSKAGAALTPAGMHFHKHALALVRAWEQARLEVSLPSGYRAALTIGGSYSLWDGFLLAWLSKMRAEASDVAIRTQIGFSNVLIEALVAGTLDVGVMYTPQSRPGFAVEMLFEEELVLVSSAMAPDPEHEGDYVYIDWGPEFQADHSLNFPERSAPGVYMELGSLGLRYLLQNSASGYFPKRLVARYVTNGRLKLVPGAPRFAYPAYVVYPNESEPELMDVILDNLRAIAAAQIDR